MNFNQLASSYYCGDTVTPICNGYGADHGGDVYTRYTVLQGTVFLHNNSNPPRTMGPFTITGPGPFSLKIEVWEDWIEYKGWPKKTAYPKTTYTGDYYVLGAPYGPSVGLLPTLSLVNQAGSGLSFSVNSVIALPGLAIQPPDAVCQFSVPAFAWDAIQVYGDFTGNPSFRVLVTGAMPFVEIVVLRNNAYGTWYSSAVRIYPSAICVPELYLSRVQLFSTYIAGSTVSLIYTGTAPPTGVAVQLQAVSNNITVNNTSASNPTFTVVDTGDIKVSARAISGTAYFSEWYPLYAGTTNTMAKGIPALTVNPTQLAATYPVTATQTPPTTYPVTATALPSGCTFELLSGSTGTVTVDNTSVPTVPRFTVTGVGPISLFIRAAKGSFVSAWTTLSSASGPPVAVPFLQCTQQQLAATYPVGTTYTLSSFTVTAKPSTSTFVVRSDHPGSATTDPITIDNTGTFPKFTLVRGGIIRVSVAAKSGIYYSAWNPLYVIGSGTGFATAHPIFVNPQMAQLAESYPVGASFTLAASTSANPISSTFEFKSTHATPATDAIIVTNSNLQLPSFTAVRGGAVRVSVAATDGGYYSDWYPLYVTASLDSLATVHPVFDCTQAQLDLQYSVTDTFTAQLTSKSPLDAVTELRSDNASVGVDNSVVTGPRFIVEDSGPIVVFVRVTSGGYSSEWKQLYSRQDSIIPMAFPVVSIFSLPPHVYIGSLNNPYHLSYFPQNAAVIYNTGTSQNNPPSAIQINHAAKTITPIAPNDEVQEWVTVTVTKNGLSHSQTQPMHIRNPVITFAPITYPVHPAPAPVGTVIELVASIVPVEFALTYVSSDTSVAELDGTTLTVIGVGTVTLTVTNPASGVSVQHTLTTTIAYRAPLTLCARFMPVITIDRHPMFPLESTPEGFKLQYSFDLQNTMPGPKDLRPTISYEPPSGSPLVFLDPTQAGATFSRAVASSGRARILGALAPLTAIGGGFSDTLGSTDIADIRALAEDAYNFLLTGMGQCLLHGTLSFEPEGDKPREMIEQARNEIAGSFCSLYQDSSNPEGLLLKKTLDQAVESVFFDEAVSASSGGTVFNASAVLPNVVGIPNSVQKYDNKLITGLMFNKGPSGTADDESDLEVFYGILCASDQHVTPSSGEALDIIRARQTRAFAALSQTATDFKATFEDVQEWEDSRSSGATVIDSLLLVRGSAFMEPRAPALARSACRFMYFYNYFFTPTSAILSPSSTDNNPFDSLVEFNVGFWFQATEAGADPTDPSGRIGLVTQGLYPLSGDLAPGKDIPVDWNITPSNLELQQLYYLKSNSASANNVPFTINISQ